MRLGVLKTCKLNMKLPFIDVNSFSLYLRKIYLNNSC